MPLKSLAKNKSTENRLHGINIEEDLAAKVKGYLWSWHGRMKHSCTFYLIWHVLSNPIFLQMKTGTNYSQKWTRKANKFQEMQKPKQKSMSQYQTCKCLFTWYIVNPSTFISFKTPFGVASGCQWQFHKQVSYKLSYRNKLLKYNCLLILEWTLHAKNNFISMLAIN